MKPASKLSLLIVLCLAYTMNNGFCQTEMPEGQNFQINDLLPVLNREHPDYLALQLKHEASLLSSLHKLPDDIENWKTFRDSLKAEIIRRTGALTNQKLPLDMKEIGKILMNVYSMRNLYFQTRPGVYATANLYIPD